LFKECNIFDPVSKLLLKLLPFVVGNMLKFQANSDIQNINTRHKDYFHFPNVNLTRLERNVQYRQFGNFPSDIKSLNHNIKIFKLVLKDHLLMHSFYNVEEFIITENSKLL